MGKNQKSEINLLEEINKKLDYLVALGASQGKERDEKIHILTGLGYTNETISTLLGIPKGTIDSTRARRKNKTIKKGEQNE